MAREPRPRLTMVETKVGADGELLSMITRIWPRRLGERCKLCPICVARPMLIASLCMVATPGLIGDDEAAMHRFDAEGGDEFLGFGGLLEQWSTLEADD